MSATACVPAIVVSVGVGHVPGPLNALGSLAEELDGPEEGKIQQVGHLQCRRWVSSIRAWVAPPGEDTQMVSFLPELGKEGLHVVRVANEP